MPNLWTHNIFGDIILNQAGTCKWLDNTEQKQLFHLGCQGPDFLFYHRFFPWQGKSSMNMLGSLMHTKACGPVLMQMANIVVNSQLSLDDPLTVYVTGFMMHHVLDRNMHPYVFTKSGSIKWDHQRFEVILDTIVVKKLLGLETWKHPAWKQIHIGSAFPASIVDMLTSIASDHYPDMAELMNRNDWNDAYRDMIRAQKIFHDPTGIKNRLTFGQIDPFVYKRSNPERDYLNEAKSTWRHPALENESSSASFWDLWEQSLVDGKQVWDAAIQYWSQPDDESRQALAEVIGNRSYEHGLDVEDGLEIRFEQPIW